MKMKRPAKHFYFQFLTIKRIFLKIFCLHLKRRAGSSKWYNIDANLNVFFSSDHMNEIRKNKEYWSSAKKIRILMMFNVQNEIWIYDVFFFQLNMWYCEICMTFVLRKLTAKKQLRFELYDFNTLYATIDSFA